MVIKAKVGKTEGDLYQIWLAIKIIKDWIISDDLIEIKRGHWLELEVRDIDLGIFDDIMVYEKKKIKFYQVKHTINMRGDLIELKDLCKPNSKISLKYMFESYKKIKKKFGKESFDLIIYSNKHADSELRKILNSKGKFIDTIRNISSKARYKNERIIKIFKEICTYNSDNLRDFLNHLHFILGQESYEGLKSITTQEIYNPRLTDQIFDMVKKSHKSSIRVSFKKIEYYLQAQESASPLDYDNYDIKMLRRFEEPSAYNSLKSHSVTYLVKHEDIKFGEVIRIKTLLSEFEQILFNSSKNLPNWIYLSGASGMSKTTQAKIFLYEKKFNNEDSSYPIFTCIIENIHNIKIYKKGKIQGISLEVLVQYLQKTNKKWILLIEDLHRRIYGEIIKKVSLLHPLIQRKNIHIITTSRMQLKEIEWICSGNNNAIEVLNRFKEINVGNEKYNDDFSTSKVELIKLRRPDLLNKSLFISEYEKKYSKNFIFLILAIKYWDPIKNKPILDGIRTFLRNQFREILNDFQDLNVRILLSAFLGAAYETIFDEFVSIKDFLENKKEMKRALKALASSTLVLSNDNIYFSLQHASLAELYKDALIEGFVYDKDTEIDINEFAILRRFRAHIYQKFDFNETFRIFTKLEEIDLSGLKIKETPKLYHLKNLKKLRLRKNKLKFLPNELRQLRNLLYLDLRSNNLKSLPETLGKLTKLECLLLDHNKIISLPNSITKLFNLKYLFLSNNNIRFIPSKICQLIDLKYLTLDRNKLKLIPKSFEQLRNLYHLKLNSNDLRKLPNSIGKLKNLTFLDISDNNLTSIPNWIGNLTKLKELSINYNFLFNLPEEFDKLTNLEVLHMGDLSLSSLPEWIENLSKLKELTIHTNLVEIIPESVGQLKNLEILDFSDNMLNNLPNSFGQLENLKNLDLSGNNLKSLPKSFKHLKNIESLLLTENNFITFPMTICHLKKIEFLALDGNKIKNIPKTLTNLTNLKSFFFESNLLNILPNFIGELKNLQLIDLNNNKLNYLPETIGQLRNLGELHLNNNNLTSLPKSIYQLSKLVFLDIENNNLNLSSENLKEILKHLKKNGCELFIK